MTSNEVTCPHCKLAMRYDATLCPHCRTSATPDEIASRVASHEEQVASIEAGKDMWRTGCFLTVLAFFLFIIIIAVLGKLASSEEQGYAVPSTVETSGEISERLADAVPRSIEEARMLAYEDARTNWSNNKAGPPSDAKVALAIQMVDKRALTDPDLSDPKIRLATYKVAVTVVHCDNPTPCGSKSPIRK